MRLFSAQPCSFSKAVYHVAGDVPGEERSGQGPNHMANDMQGQGV